MMNSIREWCRYKLYKNLQRVRGTGDPQGWRRISSGCFWEWCSLLLWELCASYQERSRRPSHEPLVYFYCLDTVSHAPDCVSLSAAELTASSGHQNMYLGSDFLLVVSLCLVSIIYALS
jgi:hypothetical protein